MGRRSVGEGADAVSMELELKGSALNRQRAPQETVKDGNLFEDDFNQRKRRAKEKESEREKRICPEYGNNGSDSSRIQDGRRTVNHSYIYIFVIIVAILDEKREVRTYMLTRPQCFACVYPTHQQVLHSQSGEYMKQSSAAAGYVALFKIRYMKQSSAAAGYVALFKIRYMKQSSAAAGYVALFKIRYMKQSSAVAGYVALFKIRYMKQSSAAAGYVALFKIRYMKQSSAAAGYVALFKIRYMKQSSAAAGCVAQTDTFVESHLSCAFHSAVLRYSRRSPGLCNSMRPAPFSSGMSAVGGRLCTHRC
eukprot:gene9038-6339_t